MNRRALLALAALLAGCQTPHEFAAPDATWRTHSGQLKFTSGDRVLIGEVLVRRRGAAEFQLEFQKSAGIPLMKIRADAGVACAEGMLARGSWQGAADQAPERLRGWFELRAAFAATPHADRLTFTPKDSSERFDFIFSR